MFGGRSRGSVNNPADHIAIDGEKGRGREGESKEGKEGKEIKRGNGMKIFRKFSKLGAYGSSTPAVRETLQSEWQHLTTDNIPKRLDAASRGLQWVVAGYRKDRSRVRCCSLAAPRS